MSLSPPKSARAKTGASLGKVASSAALVNFPCVLHFSGLRRISTFYVFPLMFAMATCQIVH